jgi:hypothetical protein
MAIGDPHETPETHVVRLITQRRTIRSVRLYRGRTCQGWFRLLDHAEYVPRCLVSGA